jgi:hypothetical protein
MVAKMATFTYSDGLRALKARLSIQRSHSVVRSEIFGVL